MRGSSVPSHSSATSADMREPVLAGLLVAIDQAHGVQGRNVAVGRAKAPGTPSPPTARAPTRGRHRCAAPRTAYYYADRAWEGIYLLSVPRPRGSYSCRRGHYVALTSRTLHAARRVGKQTGQSWRERACGFHGGRGHPAARVRHVRLIAFNGLTLICSSADPWECERCAHACAWSARHLDAPIGCVSIGGCSFGVARARTVRLSPSASACSRASRLPLR